MTRILERLIVLTDNQPIGQASRKPRLPLQNPTKTKGSGRTAPLQNPSTNLGFAFAIVAAAEP